MDSKRINSHNRDIFVCVEGCVLKVAKATAKSLKSFPTARKNIAKISIFFRSSGADSAKPFLYCEFYITTSRHHG